MSRKYLYCNRCQDYEEFNYIETTPIEGVTEFTNDVFKIYRCAKCNQPKVQIESELEAKLKREGLK